MFPTVFRRIHRSLVHVLIAAQLLLSAPIVNALDVIASDGATPCAEQMASGHHDSHCPCCPDGASSQASCLSACIATAAIVPSVLVVAARANPVESRGEVVAPIAYLADPPLKPPPIA